MKALAAAKATARVSERLDLRRVGFKSFRLNPSTPAAALTSERMPRDLPFRLPIIDMERNFQGVENIGNVRIATNRLARGSRARVRACKSLVSLQQKIRLFSGNYGGRGAGFPSNACLALPCLACPACPLHIECLVSAPRAAICDRSRDPNLLDKPFPSALGLAAVDGRRLFFGCKVKTCERRRRRSRRRRPGGRGRKRRKRRRRSAIISGSPPSSSFARSPRA